jgi:hypothetical protein
MKARYKLTKNLFQEICDLLFVNNCEYFKEFNKKYKKRKTIDEITILEILAIPEYAHITEYPLIMSLLIDWVEDLKDWYKNNK